MENEFIEWSSWDQHDTMCFSFYDAELKKDIGPFKKGEKFSSIAIAYDEGFLEFHQEDDETGGLSVVGKFKISLKIEPENLAKND